MAEAQAEKKKGRTKKATSGGWNWLKSKRGSNALLATIAGAVATGLAVAGIIVPLNDLKQRMGVVESQGKLDPILDHLETVDSALAAIQKGDPVGTLAVLGPKVQELAGQVGDINDELAGGETTTTTTAALTTTPTLISAPPATVSPTVLARLDAAESKLTQLSSSLATEQATTSTLSSAVATIREDLSAIRTELTAAKAAAAAAQATADKANRLLPVAFFPNGGGFSNVPANASTIQAQVGVISAAAGEKILFRWGGAFNNDQSLGSPLNLFIGTTKVTMNFSSTGYREHVFVQTFATAVTDAPLKVSMTCNGSSQGSTNTAPCTLAPIVVTAQRIP
jgi:outer membrane murein-binding lipoprotein Lpp